MLIIKESVFHNNYLIAAKQVLRRYLYGLRFLVLLLNLYAYRVQINYYCYFVLCLIVLKTFVFKLIVYHQLPFPQTSLLANVNKVFVKPQVAPEQKY